MSIKNKLILIILLFSSLITTLVGMNYFVMNTLSTVRAFVAGEAFYSKGQKDATYFLARYASTHKKEEYELFLDNIKIPIASRIAREELLKSDSDYKIVDAALIQGKNEPSETRKIATLFKRFKDFSFFKESIHYWTLADIEVQKLAILADEIHNQIQSKNLTPELAHKYLIKVDELNTKLTYIEDQYSKTLGNGARWVTLILYYINFTVALIGFFITFRISLGISQKILKSIEVLKQGTVRVEQGIFAIPIEINSQLHSKDELAQLAISFNKMTVSLEKALTERDLALDKLEVRAKQLSEAQEIAHIGSWELDVDTKEIIGTEEFFRIFGLKNGSSINFDDLLQKIHTSDIQVVLNQIKNTLINKKNFTLDFKIIRPDGEIREVTQRARTIVSKDGILIKIIGTIQDITERLKIHSQMLQSNKMASLGEMASGIAHEINNPLAIIKMTALQMQKHIPENNTQLKSNISKIDSTVDRISKIIQGLRIFSRDGKNDPFEIVSLDKIIEDTLSFCNERLKQHTIQLIKDDVNPNLFFVGRPIEISQVLLNLFNNAIDANSTNEETNKWIKITAKNEGNFLEIKILDSGPKIPKEILNKLFQPFFTTKEIGKGTGLGLSLSLTIIKNHYGEIYIDQESRHTCFVLKLPINNLEYPSLNLTDK